jgi:hypothetical protein
MGAVPGVEEVNEAPPWQLRICLSGAYPNKSFTKR